jgi:hypothetical protein
VSPHTNLHAEHEADLTPDEGLPDDHTQGRGHILKAVQRQEEPPAQCTHKPGRTQYPISSPRDDARGSRLAWSVGRADGRTHTHKGHGNSGSQAIAE